MAAATPGRPHVCIVPNENVLLLATELEGLGGTDVALAHATLCQPNCPDDADEIARWLVSGFNATVVGCSIAPQPLQLAAFFEQVVSRLGNDVALSVSWVRAHAGKAYDCLGRVLPSAGLRSATAVAIASLDELHSVLMAALEPPHATEFTIVSLRVFNPTTAALAECVAVLSPAAALVELVHEVVGLHASRRAGEHILRTAQLSLLAQLAAPWVGGNVRLFLVQGEFSEEVARDAACVKTVCTKTQVPEGELNWVAAEAFFQHQRAAQGAAMKRQQQQQGVRKAARISSLVSSEVSAEERQRRRISRASALLQQGVASSPTAAAAAKKEQQQQQQQSMLCVNIPENGDGSSSSSAVEALQPAKSPPRQRRSGSCVTLASLPFRASNRSIPATGGLSSLTSPSADVRYGSPSLGAPSQQQPSGSYAAAFNAAAEQRGRLWASSAAAPVVSDVFERGDFSFSRPSSSTSRARRKQQAGLESGGDAHVDGTSTSSSSDSDSDGEKELDFDLSEQAGAASAMFHHLTADNEGAPKGEEDGGSSGGYTTSITADPAYPLPGSARGGGGGAAGAAEKALAQERRVNAVLLQQLHESQRRAAAAAMLPPLDPIGRGDYDGLLAALQRERSRNADMQEKAQRAAEAQLTLEIELSAAQKEVAIARARCRALQRGTPLAAVFDRCEAAVRAAEVRSEALEKENLKLARAVADAEVAAAVKEALGAGGSEGGYGYGYGPRESDANVAIIGGLNKRLQAAFAQVKKLQGELAMQREGNQERRRAERTAAVSKKLAEDAMRRGKALHNDLAAEKARLREQSLSAAAAAAAAANAQAERDEALAALEAEQERGEELLDLAESLRGRLKLHLPKLMPLSSASSIALT